jgi:hypothetical protein
VGCSQVSMSLIQQESFPDEVARQQLYNTALEERRQALWAELAKEGVSLNVEKEPVHSSETSGGQVRNPLVSTSRQNLLLGPFL